MALNEATYREPAAFKELPGAHRARGGPVRPFQQVRNLSDKQFGQIQVPTPERRSTPPPEHFSAWGSG